MAAVDKQIIAVPVKMLQYTGSNIGEVEALIGCDSVKYDGGVLTVSMPGGKEYPVDSTTNKYIIAYAGTDYVAPDPEATPDPIEEVLYVPGVLIEVTDAAGLAARYEDIP